MVWESSYWARSHRAETINKSTPKRKKFSTKIYSSSFSFSSSFLFNSCFCLRFVLSYGSNGIMGSGDGGNQAIEQTIATFDTTSFCFLFYGSCGRLVSVVGLLCDYNIQWTDRPTIFHSNSCKLSRYSFLTWSLFNSKTCACYAWCNNRLHLLVLTCELWPYILVLSVISMNRMFRRTPVRWKFQLIY